MPNSHLRSQTSFPFLLLWFHSCFYGSAPAAQCAQMRWHEIHQHHQFHLSPNQPVKHPKITWCPPDLNQTYEPILKHHTNLVESSNHIEQHHNTKMHGFKSQEFWNFPNLQPTSKHIEYRPNDLKFYPQVKQWRYKPTPTSEILFWVRYQNFHSRPKSPKF